MTKTLTTPMLQGSIRAIASKSMAHRLMICAALSQTPTELICSTTSRDIEATKACLAAMRNDTSPLRCGESGSTLRFLLPVAAALGLETAFLMEGRLPERPLAPLDAQLRAHGAMVRQEGELLYVGGRLQPGDYTLPGGISSQFISGLLFALPLLDKPSILTVTGKTESEPYIHMTLSALRQFGVEIGVKDHVYRIPACSYQSPGSAVVEGDWSNAAFWLCAGALAGPVTVTGLDGSSLQGDKEILSLLARFGARCSQNGDSFTVAADTLRGIDIDASAIPDHVPVLAVVAAKAEGETRIFNAGRLRLKESDRIESVCQMLTNIGAQVTALPDGMIIHGGRPLAGGSVDSCGDHRIAMAAAVAAAVCQGPVTVTGAQAVEKSYPHFWEDLKTLTRT